MPLGTLPSWTPLLAATLTLITPAVPRDASAPVLNPDKLVILSTTDVKGKIAPCGCSIPKGGLARQASFADSVRSEFGNVVVVDNGGFFPDDTLHREFAPFLMAQMKLLGVSVTGLGDRDLRFGAAYLKAEQKRSGLPMVSANLIDRRTKQTLVAPSLVKQVGRAKVGFFGLISDKVDLGPARDSLAVEDPTTVAKRIVAELRKQGATVIVLLSQLGKVESEDLVTVVEGIDAVIVGRNVPLLQKGRLIKNTVACYGGEQGQYYGRTLITLDAKGFATLRESETFMLGPEVGEHPNVAAVVKDFEDAFNRKVQLQQKQKAAALIESTAERSEDRYVGNDVCARCHVAEAAQWKTTGHAKAWQTLVDLKKDATPDCVPCHVVGYQKPGGFQGGVHATHLVNVGCENCHGMGSRHEAMTAKPTRVTEETCRQCHNADTSPEFSYATYLPHVVHAYTGEKPELPKRQTSKKMMGGGGH